MIVIVIAICMVMLVLGGSYWFFVLNKPKASLEGTTVTGRSITVKIGGYSGIVFVLLKRGEFITHGSRVTSGDITYSNLATGSEYTVYVFNEYLDTLLASGIYKTTLDTVAGGPTVASSPSGPAGSPGPTVVSSPGPSVSSGPTVVSPSGPSGAPGPRGPGPA